MRVNSKNPSKSAGFIARAILSTLAGQLVDNILFYLIAFSPLGIPSTVEQSWITIVQLVGFTTLIETSVEAAISPLTALFIKHLKQLKIDEGIQTDIELGKE